MLSNCFRDPGRLHWYASTPLKRAVRPVTRGFWGTPRAPLPTPPSLPPPEADFFPLIHCVWYLPPQQVHGANTPWYTRVIMAVTCTVRIASPPGLPFDLRIIECATPARKVRYIAISALRYRLGRRPERRVGFYSSFVTRFSSNAWPRACCRLVVENIRRFKIDEMFLIFKRKPYFREL